MSEQTEPREKRLILDELRRTLDKLYSTNDSLDGKIKDLMGVTSLILAIFGTVQMSTLRQTGGTLFWIVLIIALALYAAIFVVSFYGVFPRKTKQTVAVKWETIDAKYFGEKESDVLNRIISDYLYSIDQVSAINSKKSKVVMILMGLVFVLVVVLLIAMPVSLSVTPLVSPVPIP